MPAERSGIDQETTATILLFAQQQIVEAVLSDAAADEVLLVLARAVAGRCSARNCVVLLFGEDEVTLRVAASDGLPEAYVRAIDGHSLSRCDDGPNPASAESLPGAAPTFESEPFPETYRLCQAAISCGFRASRWLPLSSGEGRVLGAVGVLFRETGGPSLLDAQLLELSARLAVVAVEHRSVCERLKTSERRFAEVQRAARIGSWERDLRTERVTWSDELYRLFSPSDGIDSYESFLSLLLPDDVTSTRETVERALLERRSFACDYRVTAPDGRLQVMHDRGDVIVDDAGEPVRLVGTSQDVTEQRQTDQKLQEHAKSLKALSRRLVQVQEQERGHLAREIHDEVGQILTGLRLLLELDDNTPQETVKTRIDQAQSLVDDLIAKTRALSFDLRPAALDQLGLVPGLLSFFDRFLDLTAVRVDFRHQRVEQRFATEVETTAYRVVQESLTNVARHAAVNEARVRVWATPATLGLQVQDRGRGFDLDAALKGQRSIGLPGMRERVELIGGRLTVESSPGAGTLVTAELPLNEAALDGNADNADLNCAGR